MQVVEKLGKTYTEKVRKVLKLKDQKKIFIKLMQAGDDEKELMQNEEENPINKKKKKSLGSIKYKVSFLGMNSASDLW